MTLVNPKPLGYAYGEVLPSGHVNSIWSQLTNAVDGIGGGTYALTAPLSITGDVVTLESLVINDDLEVASNLLVNGDATLGDSSADFLTVLAAATFSAASAVNAPMVFGGAGRVRRRISPGADADGTYGPKDWDRVRVSLNLTANRIYTIDDTGAADYDEIEFSLHSGPETLEIRNPSAGTITLLDTGGSYDWIRVIRLSGAWSLLERGKN